MGRDALSRIMATNVTPATAMANKMAAATKDIKDVLRPRITSPEPALDPLAGALRMWVPWMEGTGGGLHAYSPAVTDTQVCEFVGHGLAMPSPRSVSFAFVMQFDKPMVLGDLDQVERRFVRT